DMARRRALRRNPNRGFHARRRDASRMDPSFLDFASFLAAACTRHTLDLSLGTPISAGAPAAFLGVADPSPHGKCDLFPPPGVDRRDGKAADPLGLLSRSRPIPDSLVPQVLEWAVFLCTSVRFGACHQLRACIPRAPGATASRDRSPE